MSIRSKGYPILSPENGTQRKNGRKEFGQVERASGNIGSRRNGTERETCESEKARLLVQRSMKRSFPVPVPVSIPVPVPVSIAVPIPIPVPVTIPVAVPIPVLYPVQIPIPIVPILILFSCQAIPYSAPCSVYTVQCTVRSVHCLMLIVIAPN